MGTNSPMDNTYFVLSLFILPFSIRFLYCGYIMYFRKRLVLTLWMRLELSSTKRFYGAAAARKQKEFLATPEALKKNGREDLISGMLLLILAVVLMVF